MLLSLGRALTPAAAADPVALAGGALLAESGHRLATQSNLPLRPETAPAPAPSTVETP